MEHNEAVEIINKALADYSGETIVSKTRIVDVFLDVRLASTDPAVVAAVDDALRTFQTPTLVNWADAKAQLERVRKVAAETPVPAGL